MRLTGNQTTKRLTLLLIAVFSWLFIGSLILFHQEHVCGKHTSAFEHLFVAPKTKDETTIGLKQYKATQGDQFIPAAFIIRPVITVSEYNADQPEQLPVDEDFTVPDELPDFTSGLRAPPAA
jgi:hypothetical protein